LISFPNAKINLGLQILRKRADGYHDIASVFLPIPLTDVLEIIKSDSTSFTSSGLPIPGDTSDNLCLKAYHLLKSEFDLPPVSIHLHKVIPMGAGLGGGSADGAFVLTMLNKKFGLQLTEAALEEYASRLGSDCPFFIKNEPALALGRGTDLHRFSIDLKGYQLVLVFPGIHIGTKEAYAGVTPRENQKDLSTLLSQPIESWKDDLLNDFEASVFPTYPTLPEIKDQLYSKGALYASMTGSGSTMFGIFKGTEKVNFDTQLASWSAIL